MVVRRWALRKSACFLLLVLAFTLQTTSLGSEQATQSYQAQVFHHGTRLWFPTIPSEDLRLGLNAVLKLSFDGVQRFDARDLQIAVNGDRAEIPGHRWDKYSDWISVDGNPVLAVRIGQARFDEGRAFAGLALRIESFGGHLRIWVQSPATVREAWLELTEDVDPPHIELDSATPSDSVFTATRLTLEFHASGPTERIECSLDSWDFTLCQSPVTYDALGLGPHLFRARAVAPDGTIGPTYSRWFDVRVPSIYITEVTPPENPTTSPDISIAFRIATWYHLPVSAECRIDGRDYSACSSPISYHQLSPGNHTVDIRRVIHLFALNALIPLPALPSLNWKSLPTTYSWTISREPPVLQWVSTPSGLTNQSTATFQFQSDQDGVSFECQLDGGNAQTCSSPLTLSALAQGTHELQVIGTNASGLSSSPLVYQWVIDQTPPVVTVTVSPQQNPTNSRTLNVSFTASKPATFACNIDGQAITPCTSALALSGLNEGNHQFSITATDAAGNTSSPVVYVWTIDLTAPTMSITLISPVSLPTNQTSAVFQLSASEPATFSCSLDSGAAFACGPQVTLGNLSEGTHVLAAAPTDTAGNVGATVSFQWTVDLTPPVITITGTNSNGNSTTVDFAISEPATVTCNRDHAGPVPCTSPYVMNGLADGPHELDLQATDPAGNVSVVVSYQWTVSTIAYATLTNVVPPNSPTNSQTISISFTSQQSASFVCSLDGAAATSCTSPATYSGLADGNHAFTAQAVNAAGNPGPAANYSWAVDTVLPTIQITSVSPPQNPNASTTLQLSFATSKLSSVTCQLDGQSANPCTSPFSATGLTDGNHQVTLQATDVAGNISAPVTYQWQVITVANVTLGTPVPSTSPVSSKTISIPFTSTNSSSFVCSLDGAAAASCASPVQYGALADGQHTFQVQALNPAGSPGPAATYAWVVDTTAPVVTLTSEQPSQSPTASTSMSIAFSVSETASTTCQLDSSAAASCSSPYALSGLADGTHLVTIQAKDPAGNISTPVTYQWQVITVANVTLGTPSPSTSPVSSKTISIPFTSSNSQSFVCSLDGATASSCTSPAQYAGLADGQHTFQVKALNPAGAPGPAATYTWTVDTTPPVVTITQANPSANPTASTSMQLTFSTSEPSTVTCQFDSQAPAACTSPYSVSGLTDGAHAIRLQATDLAGNVSAVVTYNWTITTVATVSIGSVTPSGSLVSSRAISIAFSSPNSQSFICALDGATASACSSPASYSGLTDGNHTFQVQALNPSGSPGPAATYAWTIDATPPVVTLNSENPSWSPTASQTMTIAFSASESATFSCSLDGAAASTCSSPWNLSGLATGSHTASITAQDAAGNVSAPATYTWQIDTSPLAISSMSFGNVSNSSVDVSWATNFPANSQLQYSTDLSFSNSTAIDPTEVTSHAMTLSGLNHFTIYNVRAVSVDRDGRTAVSSTITFRTKR